MITSSDVALVRHVVQRILVPCVVVIGLLGNSVSIYVLTRKRMRCTTNIYLTALAITDIAYLTMALLASFQHYEYVQLNWETYYACYGIMMWLIDACAYISIYIAVCFTIERFIAIRYPLKRQTFCTESLAKKVLAGVALFCLLTTISTAFEHEYRIDTKLIDSDGRPCNLTVSALNTTSMNPTTNILQHDNTYLMQALRSVDENEGGDGDELREPLKARKDKIDSLIVRRNVGRIDVASMESQSLHQKMQQAYTTGMVSRLYPHDNLDFLLNAEFPGNDVAVHTPSSGDSIFEISTTPSWVEHGYDVLMEYELNASNTCKNVSRYERTTSDLGNNNLYRKIYFHFTLFVFVLIPLCLLGAFNCFLIMLVRRSKNVRGDLTNANSIRKSTKRKTHSSSVSQENRVTVTLIAVVLLFIVCQLPWAIYLIVSEQTEIDFKLQAIIGNIFNFLTAINAAANFFLYCVLSDKYRKTVRELITGYRYRKQRFNNNNYNNASLYTATSNGMGSNRSRSRSRQSKTPTTASTMSTSSSMIIK